jgi:WD40 repeat protein
LANREVAVVGPGLAPWCWSPDGARLLAGGGGNGNYPGYVEWWDATTFKRTETDKAGQYIFGAAVSRDGRITAAADWQGEIWLLENPGGKVLGPIDCGDIRSSALAFSPDGKFLVTASRDQAILIWDVTSRQRVRQLRGHHAKVTSLVYTPDGQILFSGDTDGKVLVWDMWSETNHVQIPNKLRAFGYDPPQFSPDGKLLALAIANGASSILDSATLQPHSSIEGEFVAFSPDSRQVAYTASHGLQRILQVRYFGAAAPRASLPLFFGDRFLEWHISPDGRYLVSTIFGRGTVLFDATTGDRLLSRACGEDEIPQNEFLADGRTFVSAAGSALGFWDVSSRQKTRTLDCGSTLLSLAVSPDSRFLAASREDLKIVLWDLRAGVDPEVLSGHQAPVWALAFSPDGRTLASGGEDRCLKLWDLTTHREIASFLQARPVYWLAFAPDGQTLVWGGIGSYEVWRAPREAPSASGPTVPPSSIDLPLTSIWRIPDGAAPVPPRVLAEEDQCRTNLLRIRAAIMSYQKDHQQMPDWLSDLVPKYLPDTNVLLCPVQAKTGISSSWIHTEDPNIASSYSYEFSAQPNSRSDPSRLSVPGDTMKTWKMRQLGRYGPVVPVLRCYLHSAVLNVTYGGELLESPVHWESIAEVQWHARNPAGAEEWYRQMEQEGKTDVLNQLAWDWATAAIPEARDGPAAVRFALKAVELTNRKDREMLDTLSAAYAETGQFDRAVAAELEAISLLKSTSLTLGTEATLKDFEARLELYQNKRPYRQDE